MPTNFFSSPFMSVPPAVLAAELDQLEKRARAINLSLAPLAARAGVRVSQISQWKAGSPVTGTTAGKHFRALWRALEEEEHKLREYLKRRGVRAPDAINFVIPRSSRSGRSRPGEAPAGRHLPLLAPPASSAHRA